ncbi:MAG: hypothetical protein IKB64_00310, partial [Paludibacteraceae bacterium]|nr:hypothetical protein [Paludibacteraceae bacterium]
ISRIGYTTPSWSSMSIILPDNIESVYMRDATFLGNKTYTKLSSLILENCLPIEIRKENFPNLKELQYLRKTTWIYPYVRRSSLDICTFAVSDMDKLDCFIMVDTLYLSKQLMEYGYSLFALEKYIVKE